MQYLRNEVLSYAVLTKHTDVNRKQKGEKTKPTNLLQICYSQSNISHFNSLFGTGCKLKEQSIQHLNGFGTNTHLIIQQYELIMFQYSYAYAVLEKPRRQFLDSIHGSPSQSVNFVIESYTRIYSRPKISMMLIHLSLFDRSYRTLFPLRVN